MADDDDGVSFILAFWQVESFESILQRKKGLLKLGGDQIGVKVSVTLTTCLIFSNSYQVI